MNNKYCIGLLATVAGAALLNRLGHRWGATDEEVYASLPGDEVIPHPMLETTHAITIQAPAAEIWPWLVQMGYQRGGWYTDTRWYAWIEQTLWHSQGSSADRILPEFQHLAVGDTIPDGPPGTAYWTVNALEPNRFLALYSTTHVRYAVPAALRNNPKLGIDGNCTWVFALKEIDERTTRLILRARITAEPRLFRQLAFPLLLPADFIMARTMLRTIKRHVEQGSASTPGKTEQQEPVVFSTGAMRGKLRPW
jgi:hypothetical protein